MSKVHHDDPDNLLIRSLFGDWPKENLAQVYTGNYFGKGEFCGRYYEIGRSDRKLGHIFKTLKPIGVNLVSGLPATDQAKNAHKILFKRIGKYLAHQIIDSGLWDLVFPVQLSSRLHSFIKTFDPELIYTQGYSLSFTNLALNIAKEFNIPIFYFPVDDWHSYLYQGHIIHRKVDLVAREIAKSASLRFALGPKMTEVLSKRYDLEFECIYNADDITRFDIKNTGKISQGKLTIGLTGSLYLGRTKCLLDLFHACQLLGAKFKINVYAPNVPVDTPRILLDSKNVEFMNLPSHDELPSILKKCDLLFLPESFDPAYRKAIELSISTKAHLYMLSQRPILVYGPPWSGTVDYAKRYSWGITVDKRDELALLNGFKLATSYATAKESTARGYAVGCLNHDIRALRKIVVERLNLIVSNNTP
jgi:hypothetical protein